MITAKRILETLDWMVRDAPEEGGIVIKIAGIIYLCGGWIIATYITRPLLNLRNS